MPRRHTWLGRKPVIGSPAKLIAPRSGARNPLITLKRVVLPAPFGPMMPYNPPSGMARSMPSSARSPPNEIPISRNTSSGSPVLARRSCGNGTTVAVGRGGASAAAGLRRGSRSSTRQ